MQMEGPDMGKRASKPRGDDELPPAGTVRWVASRKAAVVDAIARDRLTREEAIARYALSEEELDGWIAAEQAHGVDALRVTRIKAYRDPASEPRAANNHRLP